MHERSSSRCRFLFWVSLALVLFASSTCGATIHGRVEGAPGLSFPVHAYRDGQASGEPAARAWVEPSGDGGSYRLEDLLPGRYLVITGGLGIAPLAVADVEVPPGEPFVRADLAIPGRGRRLVLAFREDSTARPVPGVVCALDLVDYPAARAASDANGVAVLEGLADAAYRLRFLSAGFEDALFHPEAWSEVTVDGDARYEVRLARRGADWAAPVPIQGRWLGGGGRVLAVRIAGDARSAPVPLGPDGRFRLAAERWRILELVDETGRVLDRQPAVALFFVRRAPSGR